MHDVLIGNMFFLFIRSACMQYVMVILVFRASTSSVVATLLSQSITAYMYNNYNIIHVLTHQCNHECKIQMLTACHTDQHANSNWGPNAEANVAGIGNCERD